MEELRLAGYFDLNEIEYGILENNGQMSFLTYDSSSDSSSSQNSPSNSPPANCGTSPINTQGNNSPNKTSSSSANKKPRLPVIYVLDGRVNKNSLTTSGKNKYWIEAELKKHGINSIKEVLLYMTDTNGKIICQLYNEYGKGCFK